VLAFCAEITRLPSHIVSTAPAPPPEFTTKQTTPFASTTVAHILFPRPAPYAETVLTAVVSAAWTAEGSRPNTNPSQLMACAAVLAIVALNKTVASIK
jgi:hypothetical protein